jgi:hypothetical protein
MNPQLQQYLSRAQSLMNRLIPVELHREKRHTRSLIAVAALFTGCEQYSSKDQAQVVIELFENNKSFEKFFTISGSYQLRDEMNEELKYRVKDNDAGDILLEQNRLMAVIREDADPQRLPEVIELAERLVGDDTLGHQSSYVSKELLVQLKKTLGVGDTAKPASTETHTAEQA